MTCWKCGAQAIENTCTMCGCLQDTRQPAQSPNGKSLRYIYDKLGPAATLTNPTNFIRCLGDVFPDDEEFREQMAQVLQTNVGTHLYTMLSENKDIDEGARQKLMQIVRNKCSLPDEESRAMVYLLLDMVGYSQPQKTNASPAAESAVTNETIEISAEQSIEIKYPANLQEQSATNTNTASKKELLPVIGFVAVLVFLLVLLFSNRQANNTNSTIISNAKTGYPVSKQVSRYEITLDGISYMLPCPVTKFLDNGWQICGYNDKKGYIFFSANEEIFPQDLDHILAFKGEPREYYSSTGKSFGPDNGEPTIIVDIDSFDSNRYTLTDYYITSVGYSTHLGNPAAVSLIWNDITIGDDLALVKQKIDTFERREDMKIKMYDDGILISFHAKYEDGMVWIYSSQDKTTVDALTVSRTLNKRGY